MHRLPQHPFRLLSTMAVAAALLLTATGCPGKSGGDPSADPTAVTTLGASPSAPAPAASAAPSAPAGSTAPKPSPSGSGLVITVDGAGPYVVGNTLMQYDAEGKLTGLATGSETCPSRWFATGTGAWTGVQLSFTPDPGSKLEFVIARSNAISTPSGAKVGMTLAQLQGIYGAKGETLSVGGAKAYLVATSGKALYFELDLENKAFAIIAGNATRLKNRFLEGSDC
jgi:hypothetical protein